MCDPADLLKEAKGKPTTSYSPFCNHFNAVIKRKPIVLAPTVTTIPPLSTTALKNSKKFDVPSLADLGFDAAEATTPLRGGELVALERMKVHLERTKVRRSDACG